MLRSYRRTILPWSRPTVRLASYYNMYIFIVRPHGLERKPRNDPTGQQNFSEKFDKTSGAVLPTLGPLRGPLLVHFWPTLGPVAVHFLPQSGPVWDHHIPAFASQSSQPFAQIPYCKNAEAQYVMVRFQQYNTVRFCRRSMHHKSAKTAHVMSLFHRRRALFFSQILIILLLIHAQMQA